MFFQYIARLCNAIAEKSSVLIDVFGEQLSKLLLGLEFDYNVNFILIPRFALKYHIKYYIYLNMGSPIEINNK